MTDLLQDIHDTQHASKYFEPMPMTESTNQHQPTSERFPTENHNDEKVESAIRAKQQQSKKMRGKL
jgi:hypothetical protein